MTIIIKAVLELIFFHASAIDHCHINQGYYYLFVFVLLGHERRKRIEIRHSLIAMNFIKKFPSSMVICWSNLNTVGGNVDWMDTVWWIYRRVGGVRHHFEFRSFNLRSIEDCVFETQLSDTTRPYLLIYVSTGDVKRHYWCCDWCLFHWDQKSP